MAQSTITLIHCDRCGLHSGDVEPNKSPSRWGVLKADYWVGNAGYPLEADLCPQCSEELAKWWAEGRKKRLSRATES